MHNQSSDDWTENSGANHWFERSDLLDHHHLSLKRRIILVDNLDIKEVANTELGQESGKHIGHDFLAGAWVWLDATNEQKAANEGS